MFESLSSKLETTFRWLNSRGKLSEHDIDEAVKEIRIALLEADVNFQVVKQFCETIKSRAIGLKIQKSLSPGQMVIQLVHEALIEAMGAGAPLNLKYSPPVIIMLVGLQGSGKTTTCGKLASYLRSELKRKPLLIPADVYRPAAIDQLKTVGRSLEIDVWNSNVDDEPVQIARQAQDYAKKSGFDTILLDTAGRQQIDQELMDELVEMVEAVEPHEILLVVDAMTGQEAVNVAKGFDERLDIDGIIFTKLDGDARGGAALSIRSATNKPIKFVGVGEKSDALEVFHPERLASRILGMGDVLTLIEKATKQVSVEDAKKLQKKIKKDQFTLEDFLTQLQSIKKMGSISSLMGMVPGMGKLVQGVDENAAGQKFKRMEAIILSMTRQERQDDDLLNGSRRKRIARGSGNSVEEVNRFLKQYSEMKKVMKKLSKMGPGGFKGMGGLANLVKGGLYPQR